MKKISRRSFLQTSGVVAAMAALTACGGSSTSAASGSTAPAAESTAASSGAHEPITLMDANRDYKGLIELVHQSYPEINIEIVPYKGRNQSSYMKKQLTSGTMTFPDIYSTTQAWDGELLAENLIDLSKYPVTDLYNPVRLNDVDVDGATYLLPYDFQIQGIYYNKSLLERLGLSVPTSFAQMRDETIPKLREAGAEIADCLMNVPGYAFQYFFNVADTGFMNTRKGREWQKEFISGDVRVDENILSCADDFQEWIDAGLINFNRGTGEGGEIREHFKQGNTAFVFGSVLSSFRQNDDGTGDEYVLMPYLSEDGTQNIYITNNSRCYGLNKKLEEPGNEQKLEDALHVLEVLSTNEGCIATIVDTSLVMCSIKDFIVPETSAYYNAMTEINAGHGSPLIYNGWEDYVVPFGDAILDWIKGDGTKEDALNVLDETQAEVMAKGTTYYTNVTEELDTEQAAILSGQMFLSGVEDADAALISYNVYHPEVLSNMENGYGANGRILPGEMSQEDITIFLPTGWYDTLLTSTLTGAKIKQMAKDGCDLRDNGYPYPYVLMTKDGKELDDTAEYTVIICGTPKAMTDELNLQDTGIVGLDVAKEYLSGIEELSSATLDLNLVKNA